MPDEYCDWCEDVYSANCPHSACQNRSVPQCGPMDDPATPYNWNWTQYMPDSEKEMRTQARAVAENYEDWLRWLRDSHITHRQLHYSQLETLAHFDALIRALT